MCSAVQYDNILSCSLQLSDITIVYGKISEFRFQELSTWRLKNLPAGGITGLSFIAQFAQTLCYYFAFTLNKQTEALRNKHLYNENFDSKTEVFQEIVLQNIRTYQRIGWCGIVLIID